MREIMFFMGVIPFSDCVNWFRKQGFVLGLLLAVVLAFVWPEPITAVSFLHAPLTTDLGVALIFLLQGMSLATRQMLAGCRPLKLHIFCLSWTYLIFPLLAGLLIWPLLPLLPEEVQMGVWMLSIMPTTVASAASLTATARGAVPQAIFASVFSNVLAIFVVPVLILVYLKTGLGAEMPLASILEKLCVLILLPLCIGQLIRRFFLESAKALTQMARWLPRIVIVYIVYAAFARSVNDGILTGLGLWSLFVTLLSVITLLVCSSWLVWLSSSWLRVDQPQRIAAFFCASQKSLATGLPLIASIFAIEPVEQGTALVMIPLLLFHPLQLLLGAYLAGRFAK